MSRETLIEDLKAMNRRQLERALRGLNPAERAQVMLLVRPPAPAPAPKEVPFDVLAGLSPWLLKAIEAEGKANDGRLTAASRAAIAATLGELAASRPAPPAARGTHRAWTLDSILTRRAGARAK